MSYDIQNEQILQQKDTDHSTTMDLRFCAVGEIDAADEHPISVLGTNILTPAILEHAISHQGLNEE
jgi:hypothetical protein